MKMNISRMRGFGETHNVRPFWIKICSLVFGVTFNLLLALREGVRTVSH